MALQKGIRIHQYLDDWLVRATSHQICLQHTLTLVALCRELGWLVNQEKSELDPKQVFNFVGYQFDFREGKVKPTPEPWQTLTDKILSILSGPVCPVRQFMSLIGLLTATEKQVHLGRLHMRPIQWHLKNNWRVPESLEKVIPVPRSLHPHLKWWLEESNVLPGQPLHPLKHALQIFTDASKEGWGARPFKQHGPFIQKCSKLCAPGGTSHKWTCLPPDSTTNYRSLCHRFWTPRHGQWMHSACYGKIWTHTPSTSSHLGQSGGEVAGLPLQQDYSDCPRVAQHALVLGSSGNVQSDPPVSAQPAQSGVPTIQADPAQELVKPEPTCLAPRATAIKEQGFSEAVAARIEAPQRGSTRSVYEAKWTIFTKWCLNNQVDFRAPPLKAIADFLLHLFQDRKLQPSTIDGYRSAIADKLGNSTINVSENENLTRLLDSFHRDRPKGRRGIPSWNLSLVLHQLTKAPFEPLKEASLKHLTFKTVFLLALGSVKRRSEIHAWLHKNIRHQSDWFKVSVYPSPSFLSKNQLAKEGPDSVAPVVIPALAPTLDKSLKGDRSLCPVRALRYYLDRI